MEMLIKLIFHLVLGFCESEQSNFNSVWPETEAGQTVSLPCDGGIVTRMCSRNDNGAEWLAADVSQCDIGECIHGYSHTLPVHIIIIIIIMSISQDSDAVLSLCLYHGNKCVMVLDTALGWKMKSTALVRLPLLSLENSFKIF